MKRVAAGAHLPTPWLFEAAKRPDDRADYCLDCSLNERRLKTIQEAVKTMRLLTKCKVPDTVKKTFNATYET